jgi:lysophospholipase L1-like esterase
LFLMIAGSWIVSMATTARGETPPDRPEARNDENSRIAHEQLCAKTQQGSIDLYFVGDSITRRWGATDYPQLLEHWNASFHGWNAANFGWGGDRTQNILWRLQNGELENVRPKVFVVLAGTNNLTADADTNDAAAIAEGVEAIVTTCRRAAPMATVIVMGVFPRGDLPGVMPIIDRVNLRLSELADGNQVRYLNINDRLQDASGGPLAELFPDQLHPALPAYQVWAEALQPILLDLLGPPGTVDHGPPPTGDPKARAR